jgi:D-alanine transfer protein
MTPQEVASPTPATRPAPAHLLAGLIAALVFIGAVTGATAYERAQLRSNAANLVPLSFTEKWKGEAAPLALLRTENVLPLYGSSELIVAMPNRATDFFASYPTGFAVAPLGDRAYPVLSMALSVASLGEALRGKRVAFSLSGTWFIGDDTLNDPKIFRNHYSELQAGDLVFARHLPLQLRREFARRLLDYDLVTADFPLLNPALECLARSCAYEALLPAFAPVWATRSLFLRARDTHRVLAYAKVAKPPVHRSTQIDWSALEAAADSAWTRSSSSNRFGIADSLWRDEYAPAGERGRGTQSDSAFLAGMAGATRWRDLHLLLATLRAMGARPLILNSPLKGAWWDYRGVSLAARQRFYQHFDSVSSSYGFRPVTFSAWDADRNFLAESRSHLSGKGWAVYDQMLNAFYHDSLP